MIPILSFIVLITVIIWWKHAKAVRRLRRAERARQRAANPPRYARRASVWVAHKVFARRFVWRAPTGRVGPRAPVARRGLWRTVRINIGQHLLIAGLTGSGKSSTMRTLSAHALRLGWQLVLVDLKPDQPEGEIYGGKAKVISSPAGLVDLVRDLLADPARDGSHLVIAVDETSSLIRALSPKQFDDLCSLIDIARVYKIHFWFGCQHPSRSTLPSEIQANVQSIICHRVRSKIESDVIFHDADWAPHQLTGPGACFVQEGKSRPRKLRALWLSPERFAALPGGPQVPLSGPVPAPVTASPPISVPPPVEAVPAPLTDNQQLCCLALEMAGRPLAAKDVVEATALPQPRVSDALRALTGKAVVTKSDTYPALYQLASTLSPKEQS